MKRLDELGVEGPVVCSSLIPRNAEDLSQQVDCLQPGLDLVDLEMEVKPHETCLSE